MRTLLSYRLARSFSSALLLVAAITIISGTATFRQAQALSGALTGVTSVGTGKNFTCAVVAAGVKCWGTNSVGQLGNGTSTSSITPVAVTGLGSGVASVSVGDAYACALLVDSSVRCWGANADGQFGDGSSVSSSTPVDIGLTNVEHVSTGVSSTCFVVSGEAQCAGANGRGQLGNGTTLQSSSPVPTGLLGVTSIAVGGEFACAVDAGAAKCWGFNTNGQLGDNSVTSPRTSPVQVYGLSAGVAKISTGLKHACALLGTGGVKCWGLNASGQLGDGSVVQRSVPTDVSGLLAGVTALSARQAGTCAVVGGATKCWGANTDGQVGDGTITTALVPTAVVGAASGVGAVVNGNTHACGVFLSGALKCWGSNNKGQIGNGVPAWRNVARPVNEISSAASAVSAGWRHTCAVVDGAAKCWGDNAYGQLGDATTVLRAVPTSVSGFEIGVTAIAAGSSHTCALRSTGAWCWGRNNFGQLGNGATLDSSSPVSVDGLTSGVVALAAGDAFTCALLSGGGVRCWGENINGQLGNGANINSGVSVSPTGLTAGVGAIAAGDHHACALLTSTAVKCWGLNATSQLGDATQNDSNVPISSFGGVSGISALSLGADSTFVVAGDAVKCVGSDGGGGVCSGTGLYATVLTTVSGASSGATAVGAGNAGACAVVAGAAKCWGRNVMGQVGNHTESENVSSVEAVVGLGTGMSTLTLARSSGEHVCATTSTGALWCWGDNTYGQLGNGEAASSVGATAVALFEAPSVPQSFVATPSATTVSLQWSAPLSNGGAAIVLYRVTEATTGTGCLTLGASSCSITGLSMSSTYTFRVTAENALGISSTSTVATTTTGRPGTPTGIAGAVGDRQITVSWLAPGSTGGIPLSGYSVFVNSVVACTTLVSYPQPLQCAVGSLTNGLDYAFTVKAENANGLSEASGSVLATPATAPSAPTIIAVVNGDRALTVALNSNGTGGSPITSYDYSTDGGATWKARTDAGGATTSLGIGERSAGSGGTLSNTVTYFVCIRARNAQGVSDSSNCDIGNPFSLPPVALDDVVTVNERGITTFDPRVNDSDPEGFGLSITRINTSATWGSATFSVSSLSYDTNGEFDFLARGQVGTSEVQYTVADRDGFVDSATVEISITGMNNAPVAFPDEIEVSASATIEAGGLTVNDKDVDNNDVLTVTAVATPTTHGLVTIAAGIVRYNPNGYYDYVLVGASATDVFTYTVSDSDGATSTGWVTVRILGTRSTSAATTSSAVVNSAVVNSAVMNKVKSAGAQSFVKAPRSAGVLNALRILTTEEATRMKLVGLSPQVCVAVGEHVVTLKAGICSVEVRSVSGARVNRTWRTIVKKNGAAIGNRVVELKPITFRYGSAVPTGYTGPFIAEAKLAKNIVVVGHVALFPGEVFGNPGLSLQRAVNVKAVLKNRGVRGKVIAMGVGASAPLSYTLSQRAQVANQRVMVYLFS